jgi:hypothetical protein
VDDNMLTLEQQFHLAKINREIEKISDAEILRRKYLELAELHIEAINTYTDLIAKAWGIEK